MTAAFAERTPRSPWIPPPPGRLPGCCIRRRIVACLLQSNRFEQVRGVEIFTEFISPRLAYSQRHRFLRVRQCVSPPCRLSTDPRAGRSIDAKFGGRGLRYINVRRCRLVHSLVTRRVCVLQKSSYVFLAVDNWFNMLGLILLFVAGKSFSANYID